MKMAAVFTAPHKARVALANLSESGFIDGSVMIHHDELKIGRHVFIDQGCILFKRGGNGFIELQDRVILYREVFMESGWGGSIRIDKNTSIHPRCQINAYVESIRIGQDVMLAPFCSLYSYSHGLKPGELIVSQPLESKGPIVIGEGAWLGVGVVVTSGVTIGEGAAVGAGAVVTQDVAPNTIVAGNPAKVIRKR